MKKETIKRIINSVILSAIITIIIFTACILIVKNLEPLSKVFYRNDYFQRYMERLSQREIVYPLEILLCIFICILSVNLLKSKILRIILTIIITIIGFCSYFILIKLGEEYMFQLIETLGEKINNFGQFG